MNPTQDNLVMFAVLYPEEAHGVLEASDGEPDLRLKHFVVTDLSSDHLPWDYIVDKGIYMEMTARCDVLTPEFLREEPMPIYLTPNLWTCGCRKRMFIHDVGTPFCPSCRTYHHRLKNLVERREMGLAWRASTDLYPYWQDLPALASPSPGPA